MYTPFRSKSEQSQGRRALALSLVAGAAAAGFGVLAAAVARRDTARADERMRKRTGFPRGHPAHKAAEAMSPFGKWWTHLLAALAGCVYVLTASGDRGASRNTRSRAAGAGAVLLASTTAAALAPAMDRWLPQPPAPPGHRSRRKPVFPSGHAFGPTAVSLATAHVLTREGLARPEIAAPVAAVVPLVSAGRKLLVQKHWASDVLGGLLAGVAVAAAWLSAYETVRASGGSAERS